MAGAGIRIVADLDDERLQAGLQRLIALGAKGSPQGVSALRQIGSRLVASVIDRFETVSGPGGVPWKKSGRAAREAGQTLTDTGRLRSSIAYNLTPDGIEVGTNVVYAAIHQFGGEIRQQGRSQVLAFNARGNRFASRRATRARKTGAVRVSFAQIAARVIEMPARPFLGLDDRDRVAIGRIIVRMLERSAS